MATVLEQIAAAAEAALDAGSKPTGLVVHRSRARAVPDSELTSGVAGVYLFGSDERQHDWGAGSEWNGLLTVECRITGEPSDQLLDPIVAWIIKQLRTDAALGALIEEIDDFRVRWVTIQEEQVYGAAALECPITYHTLRDDPETSY